MTDFDTVAHLQLRLIQTFALHVVVISLHIYMQCMVRKGKNICTGSDGSCMSHVTCVPSAECVCLSSQDCLSIILALLDNIY